MIAVRRPGIGLAVAVLLVAVFAGCSSKKKQRADGPTLGAAAAAYSRAVNHLSRHQLREAIATLEQIQFTADNMEKYEPLTRIALADATFYQKTDIALIDARNLYLDFVTLYGDHPLAAYAQTQAGFCSLKQVHQPSKDQTQTFQAIDDLQVVVRRYASSPFAPAALGLLRTAQANLAKAEFLVGRFYMKRKAYPAASERFRRVLGLYPDYTETDRVLFYLGRTLLAANNDTEGRIYLDQLVHDYPESRYRRDAQKILGRSGGGLETTVGESSP